MKQRLSILITIVGITLGLGQEYRGEDFSLEGALAIFKNSNSLEEFEKSINTKENDVNNLDLNNDDEIDYINVEAIKENNSHIIILSTYLNNDTAQEIAIIGIEKTDKEFAIIQIEGNEDLYVENTIIEPFEVAEEVDSSKKGPNSAVVSPIRTIVNVWFWPCVRYVYHPNYIAWKSPYRWKKHPNFWKPWKPYKHTIFRNKCIKHHSHFHSTKTHRVVVLKNRHSKRETASQNKNYKRKKANTKSIARKKH